MTLPSIILLIQTTEKIDQVAALQASNVITSNFPHQTLCYSSPEVQYARQAFNFLHLAYYLYYLSKSVSVVLKEVQTLRGTLCTHS